jgi:hypothetical protein
MNVTVEIPDELASQMSAAGADLLRRVVETIALEEYKAERISKAQLRRALGFETRFELDDFLKAHQVGPNVTIEDLRRDVQDLQSLGLWRVQLVVADTGPINYLILIGHIDVLPALFQRVILPAVVHKSTMS